MASFVGKLVLANNTKKMDKEEFVNEWKSQLPQCLDGESHCNLKVLQGSIIFDKSKNEIELFEEKDLSSNVKQRFCQLFEKKKEWSLQEISPYLQVLANGGSTTVDKLLIKYARGVRRYATGNGNDKVYTSRK